MNESDILQHYGIKGMKWGIRRTEEQLARARGSLTSKVDKALGRSSAERAERNRRAKVRKSVRTTSDEDLRKEVNRLELEKKYKSLSDEDLKPGRTAVKKFFKTTGGRVITSAAIGSLAYAGYLAVGGKDPEGRQLANYLFPNPNRKK